MCSKKHICACCGLSECDIDDEYSICPICKWAYDLVQEDDPDYFGGCNNISLNEARIQWSQKLKEKIN